MEAKTGCGKRILKYFALLFSNFFFLLTIILTLLYLYPNILLILGLTMKELKMLLVYLVVSAILWIATAAAYLFLEREKL